MSTSKKYETVAPKWLLKLKESGMSCADISREIGKSDGYASLAISNNFISKTSELACEFIWHKKFGLKNKAEKTNVCLVTVDEEHVKTIQTMVEAFGGNMSVCTLNK